MTDHLHPRRLLLISYEYPPVGGGTGKAVMNTARELARLGYETSVLTSRFASLPAEEKASGFTVYRIPALRRHLNFASAPEVLSFAISGAARAGRLAREFRPDLCLAYHTIPSGIIARALAARASIPFFTLLRGQDVPGYPETPRWMHRLAWPVTGHVWKRSLRVVANSQGLADLADESAPELRIEVVPNGIDLELYHPAPGGSDPKPEGRIRILYVGRLIRAKRIRELTEAAAMLADRISVPIELHLAGHGPERPIIEASPAFARLGVRARFLGRLDEPEVIEALQSADIFVNPSDGEGLPNAVLEAMACGLPVVVSDIGPHRELIGNEEAGLFCEGRDPASIASALERLIASPERRASREKRASREIRASREKRASMGARAREIVQSSYSWANTTRRLSDLFPGRA